MVFTIPYLWALIQIYIDKVSIANIVAPDNTGLNISQNHFLYSRTSPVNMNFITLMTDNYWSLIFSIITPMIYK